MHKESALEQLAPIVPIVSHELNTALATVLGNAHILRERGNELDPASRFAALVDIETNAERLFSAIQNLLLFAKLETGVRPHLQPTLFREILNKHVSLEQGRRMERVVRLRSNQARQPVAVDESLMKVMLRNLLENACDYSESQHEVITVLLQRKGSLLLLVLDRGPGILETEKELIFAPFFRSSGLADRAPGLGLGLTVAKRIAQLHGGDIQAGNRARGGACFSVTLPVLEPGDAEVA
jgi:K+-sensing histidine kinase KdpD